MLKRIYQHFFLIATIVLGVLCLIFLHRLTGDSPKVSDIAALIVCTASFGMSAVVGFMEGLERKLENWLEPKTGGSSSGSVNTVENFWRRSPRDELLHSLALGLAPYLVNSHKPDSFGAYIREAADAILGDGAPATSGKHKCLMHGSAQCDCALKYVLNESEQSAGEAADQAAKASAGPRVTPADIEAEIDAEIYFTAAEAAESGSGIPTMEGFREKYKSLECLTFCVLVLRNGFTVTGESACASPENFNAEIGRRIARENAIEKCWPLLGFRLRDKLSSESSA